MLGLGGLPVLLDPRAGCSAANYLMVSGHLRDAGRIRLVVTLVFGADPWLRLRRGIARTADTARKAGRAPGRLQSRESRSAQVSLVLFTIGVAALLVKLKLALPRPIVTDVAAAFLVGLGFFWFLQR